MVLGKRWLFLIGNGAEFWPLEKGRKSPGACVLIRLKMVYFTFITDEAETGSHPAEFHPRENYPQNASQGT